MNTADLAIRRLTDAGISVNEIIEKLKIERGMFYSWRRSVKASRREEMAEKIIELFPKYFQEGWESEVYENEIAMDDENEFAQKRYIRLLEDTVRELRKDKDRLEKIIDILSSKK